MSEHANGIVPNLVILVVLILRLSFFLGERASLLDVLRNARRITSVVRGDPRVILRRLQLSLCEIVPGATDEAI